METETVQQCLVKLSWEVGGHITKEQAEKLLKIRYFSTTECVSKSPIKELSSYHVVYNIKKAGSRDQNVFYTELRNVTDMGDISV